MTRLRTFKRTRRGLYAWARTMGNWQPFLELALLDPKAPRKIVRRQVHRVAGKFFSRQLFGSGFIAKAIKSILGL